MLHSFGSNGSGQLGLGHQEDVSIPTKCLLPVTVDKPPVKIAAGGNHTVVLFSNGAFATGENAGGRCGFGATPMPSEAVFARIKVETSPLLGIDGFKLCAATWEATTFISYKNDVYSCGIGSRGQLGMGDGVIHSGVPQRILHFPPAGTEIIDVASCMAHTIVVLSNGDAYGWGDGRKGQLGEPAAIVWSPRKIEGITFPVDRAACGREFTYLVGSPVAGRHLVLGLNKWGVKSSMPESIQGWKDIGASWGSIYVLQGDNRLLSWGRNDHGQLAPAGIPELQKIAIGSEHALGLTLDGKLVAWGWGEHGNCGPELDDDGDVKGRWNEIPLPRDGSGIVASASEIGAGCASSWIFTDNITMVTG
ncbi:hypothetical protein FGG08_003412 [Glutinoglossum americanum]|uniref:RCC1-like domain-containing protein n=1 Tax=Glutinoglossum americanum TaxID=1670608 RepID=A0A9P8I7S2_9PEZI|nr:hypothetical protein FGG08_003412 [Glutinoglossum americanum]